MPPPGTPAPEPLPASAPIDGLDTARLDTLRDLDPGDTSYLDRAIDNFEVNSQAALSTLRDAVAISDVDSVVAVSHKIAGSALNLGCPIAGRAALDIETLARAGSLDGVDTLLDVASSAMGEARGLLRVYQATYQAGH